MAMTLVWQVAKEFVRQGVETVPFDCIDWALNGLRGIPRIGDENKDSWIVLFPAGETKYPRTFHFDIQPAIFDEGNPTDRRDGCEHHRACPLREFNFQMVGHYPEPHFMVG